MIDKEYVGRLSGFDEYVEAKMDSWQTPGVQVCIVKDGEIIHSKGYGYRDPEQGFKMSSDTMYSIASNTKAFTSMAIAMLVDQGLIDWNAPLIDYIPYFALKDPYASPTASTKDLLAHTTGLPAHDWARFDKSMGRADITREFRHLDMSFPIRTKHQYNNWMYMVAGHLVECVTKRPYEEFVQERILAPLGMTNTTFSGFTAVKHDNFCQYHYLSSAGEVKKCDYRPPSETETIWATEPGKVKLASRRIPATNCSSPISWTIGSRMSTILVMRPLPWVDSIGRIKGEG